MTASLARILSHMFIDPVAVRALQNMLAEIEALISTSSPDADTAAARCLELVQAARALTNDMMKRGIRIQ